MSSPTVSSLTQSSLTLTPIGVVHSPFTEKRQAPRQSVVAPQARGQIELFADRQLEHALDDIEQWSHLWVLFWFHLNTGWRPMVRPPRGQARRGVLSTRSPHRPNPIGLSVVKLEQRRGLVLDVSGLDILDETPVLDIKPYVAYTDALTETSQGWLQTVADPIAPFDVGFESLALAQLQFLGERGVALEDAIRAALALGPEQPKSRRIKRTAEGFVLAIKDWRVCFVASDRAVQVQGLRSGYRSGELIGNAEPALELHRMFNAHWT